MLEENLIGGGEEEGIYLDSRTASPIVAYESKSLENRLKDDSGFELGYLPEVLYKNKPRRPRKTKMGCANATPRICKSNPMA